MLTRRPSAIGPTSNATSQVPLKPSAGHDWTNVIADNTVARMIFIVIVQG